MATDKQIEANRLNAQKCTGPKTEEGKVRASQNALKTGIYAKADVLITESQEAYEQLIAAFYEQFAPATPQESCLLDALIRYEWLSRRYMAADTAAWNRWLTYDNEKDPGVAFLRYSGELARAGRYFAAARKGFTQTLKELKALQTERKEEEAALATPDPQPEQIQQPAAKLVSFPQLQNEPHAQAEPDTELSIEEEKIPPIAA